MSTNLEAFTYLILMLNLFLYHEAQAFQLNGVMLMQTLRHVSPHGSFSQNSYNAIKFSKYFVLCIQAFKEGRGP